MRIHFPSAVFFAAFLVPAAWANRPDGPGHGLADAADRAASGHGPGKPGEKRDKPADRGSAESGQDKSGDTRSGRERALDKLKATHDRRLDRLESARKIAASKNDAKTTTRLEGMIAKENASYGKKVEAISNTPDSETGKTEEKPSKSAPGKLP